MTDNSRSATAYTKLQIETANYTMSEAIVYDLTKVNRAIKHYKEDLEMKGWLDESTAVVIACLLETVADLRQAQSDCSKIYAAECNRINWLIQNGAYDEK